MSSERIRLEGISPRTWEHPSDRAALTVLTQIPGVAEFLKSIAGMISDRSISLNWMASSLRSSPLQIPAAHQAVSEACRVLDVSPVPEVYVSGGLDYNAAAIGLEKPIVVLGGGLVQSLSPAELLFVAGHEVAHIKAGHALYRTIVWLMQMLSRNLVGSSIFLELPFYAALMDWERKSEISCDRAGLLATQDPKAALGALLKICYPGLYDRIDEGEILRQGAEWEASGDLLDSVFKVMGTWNTSHPLLVQRYAALHQWSQDEEYPAILAGTLRREDGDPAAEVRQAWDSWKADLNKSKDPGTKMVADAVREVEGLFKDLFGR